MYLNVKENELIINRNIPYILNFNNKPAKNNDIEVEDSRCTSGNQTIEGKVGILIKKGIIISKLSKKLLIIQESIERRNKMNLNNLVTAQ